MIFLALNQLLIIALQVFRGNGGGDWWALIHGSQILIDLRLQLPPGALIQSIGLAEVLRDPPNVISLPKCEVHDPKGDKCFLGYSLSCGDGDFNIDDRWGLEGGGVLKGELPMRFCLQGERFGYGLLSTEGILGTTQTIRLNRIKTTSSYFSICALFISAISLALFILITVSSYPLMY